MQTLIDTTYLKANFDISEDVDAARLAKNIGAASRRLRSWVTDAAYQSVLSIPEPQNDVEPDGYGKKEDFRLAEANLAMHFATLGLNTPITSKGITKSSKAKDSSVISYLTPDEIAAVRRMYLEQAEEILRPYWQFADALNLAVVTDQPLICRDGFCQS